jgi:hypothetical protein
LSLFDLPSHQTTWDEKLTLTMSLSEPEAEKTSRVPEVEEPWKKFHGFPWLSG